MTGVNLTKHHLCTPDDPIARIHAARTEQFELIDANDGVLQRFIDFLEAKRVLDEDEVPFAQAVRCIHCGYHLAKKSIAAPGVTEHLARIDARSHHTSEW